MTERPMVTAKWSQRSWFITFLLTACVLTFDILFPLGIAGLILMWRRPRWKRSIKWIVTFIVPAPIYIVVLAVVASHLNSNGATSSAATIGHFCVNGPAAVAAGPRDSIYMLDSTHLLHVAMDGQLLWQRAAGGNGGIAVDAQGNVYDNDPSFVQYQNRGFIEKIGPTGIVLARWPARETTPAVIDRQGTIYAINTLDSNFAIVKRFSPLGHLLRQWRSPIVGQLVQGPGRTLYALGAALERPGSLVQVSSLTGKVLRRWPLCHGCSSYDALTADAHGSLFVGTTGAGNPPFSIGKLILHASGPRFVTTNTAQEQVDELAVETGGNIFVIRRSYARPGPSDTGLDELSAQGAVIGTFRPCHPNQ